MNMGRAFRRYTRNRFLEGLCIFTTRVFALFLRHEKFLTALSLRPWFALGTETAVSTSILFTKRDFVYVARNNEYRCPAGERAIHRFTTVEHDMSLRVYWPSACPRCHLKERCSSSDYRRIRRWEHEHILEAMQRRLDRKPDAMTIRRSTVEHVFGTLKQWMGATHFLTRTLGRVSTEMSLQVLAYNLKRVMNRVTMDQPVGAVKATLGGYF